MRTGAAAHMKGRAKMSQGALLFSSIALTRSDMLAAARAAAVSSTAEVKDFAEEEPGAPASGLRSQRVRLTRGREFVYIAFYAQEDVDGSRAAVSQQLGVEQRTMLVMDTNSLELALEVAYAFAARWPAVLEYGGKLYDSEALLAIERETRERAAQKTPPSDTSSPASGSQ
jgi:hypothetical protein